MALGENPVFTFDAFRLEPDERLLIRDGQPVALTPKAFDLLVLLVAQAGHVLGKDELIGTLWQQRLVTESNLTKHVWMLRRALGEPDEGGRYIETVPKAGYRFVAPVSATHAAASTIRPAAPLAMASTDAGPDSPIDDTAAPPQPEAVPAPRAAARDDVALAPAIPAPDPSAPRPWAMRAVIAAGVVLIAIFAVVFLVIRRDTVAGALVANPPGSTLAIVQFDNLAQNPRDGWIGPALAQMLGTEIALGGHMHTLPQELVQPAEDGLPAAQTGGYAPASLAVLRKRLGTDYVLSGSYLVAGAGDAPSLRVDLALQDARSGTAVATFSRSGPVTQLPQLVAGAGNDLRVALGTTTLDPQERKFAVNAEPPTVEVMRRVGYAIDALHHYDPARARDELLEAIADAPAYAPAYAYLAQAWSALGYNAKALAAAQQAEAHAGELPQMIRLQIAAQRSTAQFAWPSAIENLQKLVALDEHDPEYRLQLIAALLAAGKPADAATALAALRRLRGPVQNDARIELAAARVAEAQGDGHAAIEHAKVALAQATAREAAGLMADAQMQIGIGKGGEDPKSAATLFDSAMANFRKVGNPHGEAWAHQNIGNLFLNSDPRRARDEYEHALAGYQAIGDRNGIAAAYRDLGIMLWGAGDRDGAETAVRHALDIGRETANLADQAWALTALATMGSDEAATDEVVADYRRALALDESADEHKHHAFTLYSLADTLRLRGELADAEALCEQAHAEYAKLDDAAGLGASSQTCAQVAMDRGLLPAAQRYLEAAQQSAQKTASTMTLGNVELMEGEVAMADHQWPNAVARFGAAEKEYRGAELVTGQAIASAMLALAYAETGDVADRDAATARARELRSGVTERQEVFEVDIALAELRGKAGDHVQASALLQTLAGDAQKRNWIAWSLEAKFAALQWNDPARTAESYSAQRAALAREAGHYGFGWIVQRLGASWPARGA